MVKHVLETTPTYHLWRCSRNTCDPGETCSSASQGEGGRSRCLLLAEELPFVVSAEKRKKRNNLLSQYLDNVKSNQTHSWKEMMWFGILQIPIYPKNFSPFLPSSVLASCRTGWRLPWRNHPLGQKWTPLYLMSQEHVELSKKITVVEQKNAKHEMIKCLRKRGRHLALLYLPMGRKKHWSWTCCHNLFYRGTITWTTKPDSLPGNSSGWHRVLEQILGQLLHHGMNGSLLLFAKAHWRKGNSAVWECTSSGRTQQQVGSLILPSHLSGRENNKDTPDYLCCALKSHKEDSGVIQPWVLFQKIQIHTILLHAHCFCTQKILSLLELTSLHSHYPFSSVGSYSDSMCQAGHH